MIERRCPRYGAGDLCRRHRPVGPWWHGPHRLQKTHDLSPEERAPLFRYCWSHAAAKCIACFRHQELAADLFGHGTNLCPSCRADLTESLRGHIYSCAMLPEEVRRRAREARDAAAKLRKQAHQAADRADGLMREAEAAIAALRETMRRATSGP